MKKFLVTAMFTGMVGSVAFATTNVSSANIVGYVKDVAPAGFHIAGMQFDDGSNTVSTVYGDQLPKGSKVYLFNGLDYDISTYTDIFVPIVGTVTKWSVELDLSTGSGYWVEVAGAITNTLSGDVPTTDVVTNSIREGFTLLSYPYPVDRVVTNLGLTPIKGDKVYVFNGVDYDISTYTDIFVPAVGTVTKWSVNSEIPAGMGFWYETTNATDWVVTRPFDL